MESFSFAKFVKLMKLSRIQVDVLPDGRMTRADAARYLGHDKATLSKWQTQGKGPPSVKVGGRIFYFKTDLDRFVRGEPA